MFLPTCLPVTGSIVHASCFMLLFPTLPDRLLTLLISTLRLRNDLILFTEVPWKV